MPAPFTSAIDSALGIHDDALLFRSARSRVLASNLANADTPNFKARDLDFQQVLKEQAGAADGGVGLRKTHARHIGVVVSPVRVICSTATPTSPPSTATPWKRKWSNPSLHATRWSIRSV